MSRIFVTFLVVSMVYSRLCSGQALVTCGPNAELRICGKLCEPTCERPVEVICDPINPSDCKRECRCKSTYVRDTKTGECIKPDQCPCRSRN